MKQGLEEVLILILDFLIQLAQRNKNLTRRTTGVVRNTTFFPQIGIFSDAIPWGVASQQNRQKRQVLSHLSKFPLTPAFHSR